MSFPKLLGAVQRFRRQALEDGVPPVKITDISGSLSVRRMSFLGRVRLKYPPLEEHNFGIIARISGAIIPA